MEGDHGNDGNKGPEPQPVAPTPPPAPAPGPYTPPPAPQYPAPPPAPQYPAPPPAPQYPAPPPAPQYPAPPQYRPPPQQAPYQPPPQTPYPQPYPQQPAPYQPPPAYPQAPQAPQQGYAAPAPVYAPPAQYPPQQGYQQPMPPGFAPPPAAKRGGSRTLLIIGVVAAFLILVLGGGGLLANASLSSTYSPSKAVSDYLAAQARGDASYMFANANYLKGDTGSAAFFTREALTAMMSISDNKSVSGVHVTGTTQVDSNTSKVTAAMTWSGNSRTQTYTVHKDTTRSHYAFYNDWTLDIPAATITVALPNQPGSVSVDGISATGSSISVIQGFHTVTMGQTTLYDTDNESANAVEGSANVNFAGKLNSNATAQANASIKAAFADNSWCDAGAHTYCPGHTYKPAPGTYEVFTLPNGKKVNAYTSWLYTYTGDPTSNLKLTVSTTSNEVTASGNCGEKLVLDGKQTVNFAGTWTGTLTWNNGAFDYDILLDCRTNVV